MRSCSLVVGGDGNIGAALLRNLSGDGLPPVGTSRRPDAAMAGLLPLDLSSDAATWNLPENISAAVLCAAVTNTERCRRDPEGTRRINVDNTFRLVERLVASGCFVIFPSTNLVFDGETPHCPANAPRRPACEYGRQKAESESLLLSLGENVAVLRLSKVLTPRMPLFARWRNEILSGRVVRAFSDMPFAPVPLDLVVQAIVALLRSRSGGIWQLSAAEDISYADAARSLCSSLGAPSELVLSTSWREALPALEHVPQHTTLDSTLICTKFALEIPLARQTLAQFLETLQ